MKAGSTFGYMSDRKEEGHRLAQNSFLEIYVLHNIDSIKAVVSNWHDNIH